MKTDKNNELLDSLKEEKKEKGIKMIRMELIIPILVNKHTFL